MFEKKTNVLDLNEDDYAFFRILTSLSHERKTLIKGILIGLDLQDKPENGFEHNQPITGRQLTLMEYGNEKII